MDTSGLKWLTDGADEITAWGSGTDLDGTSKTTTTSDDVTADNEIRGKGGDDIIFGYAGGDRIEGGLGNDFIDGGADGITQGGWTLKTKLSILVQQRTTLLIPIQRRYSSD